MSPRARRRAAERQNLKLAATANQVITASAAPIQAPTFAVIESSEHSHEISGARLAANRANAQLSTGPKPEAGKAKSSMNAVKTGLTGRTVLLPTDDSAAYQQHLDRHFAEFAPLTDKEKVLVQNIADTEWRLLRIAPLEAAIYAIGRRKLAEQFAEENPVNRDAFIQGETFMTYRKDFSNLALQERRLRNQRKADIAELLELQHKRLEKEKQALKNRNDEYQRALKIAANASRHNVHFDPLAHGFEFSAEEFGSFSAQNLAQRPLTETDLGFHQWLVAHRAAKNQCAAA